MVIYGCIRRSGNFHFCFVNSKSQPSLRPYKILEEKTSGESENLQQQVAKTMSVEQKGLKAKRDGTEMKRSSLSDHLCSHLQVLISFFSPKSPPPSSFIN